MVPSLPWKEQPTPLLLRNIKGHMEKRRSKTYKKQAENLGQPITELNANTERSFDDVFHPPKPPSRKAHSLMFGWKIFSLFPHTQHGLYPVVYTKSIAPVQCGFCGFHNWLSLLAVIKSSWWRTNGTRAIPHPPPPNTLSYIIRLLSCSFPLQSTISIPVKRTVCNFHLRK